MVKAETKWVGGFERYQHAMLNAVRPMIDSMSDHDRERGSQSLDAALYPVNASTFIPPKRPSRDESMALKLFRGMSQISDVIDLLRDVEVYLTHFSYKNRIVPYRFLRYHVTNYYNTTYVLQLRLQQYVTIIERIHRFSSHTAEVVHRCETSRTLLKNSMGQVVEMRGKFIHERHFADEHVDRLIITHLLSMKPNSEGGKNNEFAHHMDTIHKVSFQKARKFWQLKIAAENASILQLLDLYFHLLHDVVFAKNNEIIFPLPTKRAAKESEKNTTPSSIPARR